ncbi:MAG: hypothetical protein ACJ79Y_15340 [Myxococcales bacterium]
MTITTPPPVTPPTVAPADQKPPPPVVPEGPRQIWVQHTSGMVGPHFDNGYSGAFDASPSGRPDSFLMTGWNQATPDRLSIAYGVLGQPGPIAVSSFPTPGGYGLDYGSSWQDSASHDLHVVYYTFGGSVQYWRFRPERSGKGGAIAGVTVASQFGLSGAKTIDYPYIQEIVDGDGVRRLVVYGVRGVVADRADLAVLMTTPSAGLSPASDADFAGPNGEAGAVTVATLPTIPYDAVATLAQHRSSRKIEVLGAVGQHGVTGPHRGVTLTPAGGGWTVGPVRDLPDSTGSDFAVPGRGDEVWLLWSDASSVHLSTIDSKGAVTLDAVPTPMPAATDYRGARYLAVAPDGRLRVIWYLDSASPPAIRSNVHDGTAWAGWLDVDPAPGPIFEYAPLQGLASQGGRYWGATALSVGGAETSISAASF